MKKNIIIFIVVLLVAVISGIRYYRYLQARKYAGFACGNGRLEATEVNIATKLAGRISTILVREGDLVKKGDKLAIMQTNSLIAKRDDAIAKMHQAETNAECAKAEIEVARSEIDMEKATLEQKKSILDANESVFRRTENLVKKGAETALKLDTDRGNYLSAKGAYSASVVSVKRAEARLQAAIAKAKGAETMIRSCAAEVAVIQADLDDSTLYSPLPGRIQYRVTQPGEVLAAGGKVLNLIDLTDVFMTFYLPAEQAGQVSIGANARIILDCKPQYPIQATISYVSSSAQFTPKTVETKNEREKLMFRIKARIDARLLEKRVDFVKTGLPGVVWVQLDPSAPWPKHLKNAVTADNVDSL